MTPESQAQEAVDDAAAQLLIAIAFLVPKGTNVHEQLGPLLTRYKNAIEQRAAEAALSAHREALKKLEHEVRETDEGQNVLSWIADRLAALASPRQDSKEHQGTAQQHRKSESAGRH